MRCRGACRANATAPKPDVQLSVDRVPEGQPSISRSVIIPTTSPPSVRTGSAPQSPFHICMAAAERLASERHVRTSGVITSCTFICVVLLSSENQHPGEEANTADLAKSRALLATSAEHRQDGKEVYSIAEHCQLVVNESETEITLSTQKSGPMTYGAFVPGNPRQISSVLGGGDGACSFTVGRDGKSAELMLVTGIMLTDTWQENGTFRKVR